MSRRRQFWALRHGLTWELVACKTVLPVDRIKTKWASYIEDPVFFCTLAPTDVNRPAAERWSQEFEVVGLTGHKKISKALFKQLEEESKAEQARRLLVTKDPAQIVAEFVTQQVDFYAGHVREFSTALDKTTVQPSEKLARTLFSRDWGTSYVRVMRSESVRLCAIELLASMNNGAAPLDAVEHAISTVLERVRSGRMPDSRLHTGRDLVTYFLTSRTLTEHFEQTIVSAGELDFVAAARVLADQLRAVLAAQKLQHEIDQARRGRSDHPIPPLPPKPKRTRRVRCGSCQQVVPAAGSHKAPEGGWIGECCWGKAVVEKAEKSETIQADVV